MIKKRISSLKQPKKIGIKFCGNCNPQINTVQLLQELKNHYNNVEFVKWDELEYDLLIILSSCSVGCATHPNFMGTKIILNSNSINYETVSLEELFDEVINKIDKLYL